MYFVIYFIGAKIALPVDIRDEVRKAFITDITIIYGDAQVEAPAGFTKIDVDINFGASGTFVYLCYQKGIFIA